MDFASAVEDVRVDYRYLRETGFFFVRTHLMFYVVYPVVFLMVFLI